MATAKRATASSDSAAISITNKDTLGTLAMTVVEDITEYVKSDLLQGANMSIGPDDALIEDGILTSLQTVELVMFIEDKYGIEIEPELVNEDNFRTLGAVAEIVESKLGV